MTRFKPIGSVGRGVVAHGTGIMFALAVGANGAWAQDNCRSADGFSVYLGIMPAPVVRGHPPTRAGRTIPGDTRANRHAQHIVIAVFDAQTGARIEDAQIIATVSGLKDVACQRIRLEPTEIAGTIAYGAFVDFAGRDLYEIAVEIIAPGRPRPVLVNFTHDHH